MRRCALQALYQFDILDDVDAESVARSLADGPHSDKARMGGQALALDIWPKREAFDPEESSSGDAPWPRALPGADEVHTCEGLQAFCPNRGKAGDKRRRASEPDLLPCEYADARKGQRRRDRDLAWDSKNR